VGWLDQGRQLDGIFWLAGGGAVMLWAMNDPHAIRVLLRNAEGKYLAGTGLQGELTEDRARAAVFDYLRDRVAERLEMMQGLHGTTWRPVLVDPREVCEVCDRCGQRVMSFKAFFDGRQFLCPACRSHAAE
jgi:formylmethanofuran dehydrogenase subunit E